MPPAWSWWAWEFRISRTSSVRKPSLRMLASIRGADWGRAPSRSTWPAGDVTSTALSPAVPT